MKTKHILVIDDESYWLDMMDLMLDSLHYEYTLLTSPKEALDLLKSNAAAYSVVLLDLMMPEMDGLEFLAEIAKYPDISFPPIILQTGSQKHELIKQAIDLGASSYLGKPFTIEGLSAALEAYNDNRPANEGSAGE